MGKILYLKSIICPASKLHITVLVIKREPCDVNLTRGLENTRRNVGTAPSISHHHIGREGAIKLLISTATISVKFFHFYIISTDLLYMRTSGFQMFLKNRILIILHPMLEHWIWWKKIPRQFGQWSPLETPICLNMPLVLKKIPWVFFEKMHFEKFKLLYQKHLGFKKYFRGPKKCKIQFWTTFVFCTKFNNSTSFQIMELWNSNFLRLNIFVKIFSENFKAP